jgi:hypothetical protein
MTKLLVFIGENQKFDVEMTIGTISAMSNVKKARRGEFIGAVFECEYNYEGTSTVVRLSQEAETISVEGIGPCALSFAIELQKALEIDLRAIDMEYSFDVALRDFQPVEQLERAVLD